MSRHYRNNVFSVHNNNTIILNLNVPVMSWVDRTYDCPLPLTGTVISEPGIDAIERGFTSGTLYPPNPSVKNYFRDITYFVGINEMKDVHVTYLSDKLLTIGRIKNDIHLLVQYNYNNTLVEFIKEIPFNVTGITQFWGDIYLFGSSTGITSENYVYRLEVNNPSILTKLILPNDWDVTAVSSILECQNSYFETDIDDRCQSDLPMPCKDILTCLPPKNLPFINELKEYGSDENPSSFNYYSLTGYGFGDVTLSSTPITACTCNTILPEIKSNAIKLGTSGPYEYMIGFGTQTRPKIYLAIYNISPNEEINFTAKEDQFTSIDIRVDKIRNFSCFTSVSGNKIIGDPSMSCIGGGLYVISSVDPLFDSINELKIYGNGGNGGIYVALLDDPFRDLIPVICNDNEIISEGEKTYNGVSCTSEGSGKICYFYNENDVQCGNLAMTPTKFGFGCGGDSFTYKLKFSEYVNDIILLFSVFNDGDTTYFYCDSGPITVTSINHCNVTPIGNSIEVNGCCPNSRNDIGGIFKFSSPLPYTSLTFTSLSIGFGYTVRIDCGSVVPYNSPTPTPMATPPPTFTPGPTGISTNGFTIYKHFGKIGDDPVPTIVPYTIYKNFGI